jgi:FkbM family methyltransferase
MKIHYKEIRSRIFKLVLDFIFPNSPNRVGQVYLNKRCQFVWLNEHVGRKIYLRNFERKESLFFQKYLKEGDVCLDLGANVGYYTHLFAQLVGKSGGVIAVEPVPLNLALIHLASLINKTDKIITIIDAAVADNNRQLFLSAEGDSSYANVFSEEEIGGIPVRGRTLDSIINDSNLRKIDILKMDVEGIEYRALLGMKGALSNKDLRPRLMMIELYSDHLFRYNNSIEQVCKYLESFGYRAMVLNKKCKLIPYEPIHYNEIYNVFFLI